jgi:hypothetical protein
MVIKFKLVNAGTISKVSAPAPLELKHYQVGFPTKPLVEQEFINLQHQLQLRQRNLPLR